MVCVCNATYCDEFPPLVNLNPNEAAVYISSISGKRFENSTINFTPLGNISIGYTIGRVPMEDGDTDDDVINDFELNHFNLTKADFLLKIPMIKAVKQLVGDKLKLFATPWTAPAWMKASGKFGGGDINSQLKGDMNGPYYRTWANYFIKYFEAYAEQGINFWGMTVQNEPVSGVMVEWQAMFMNAEMHR
uniref:Glucosylceramidase n=1 Tax=Acrobeloides nanus TaxID=290746 RepID=A0A914E3P8_9BILA